MFPENIVIGKPLVDLRLLGIENEEVTVFDQEKFLPKLLKKYGFFKSISQIKKNRPDLLIELNKVDFIEFKIGHKRLWLIVGEKCGETR